LGIHVKLSPVCFSAFRHTSSHMIEQELNIFKGRLGKRMEL